jgi:hypothetical protein
VEETRQLVERIIYDPERVKWRQEWRAQFERLLSKDACSEREVSFNGSGSPSVARHKMFTFRVPLGPDGATTVRLIA